MDIQEFKTRKSQMETEIKTAVTQAINAFRADTGYSPASIDVQLLIVERMGDDKHDAVVEAVSSDVEI